MKFVSTSDCLFFMTFKITEYMWDDVNINLTFFIQHL